MLLLEGCAACQQDSPGGVSKAHFYLLFHVLPGLQYLSSQDCTSSLADTSLGGSRNESRLGRGDRIWHAQLQPKSSSLPSGPLPDLLNPNSPTHTHNLPLPLTDESDWQLRFCSPVLPHTASGTLRSLQQSVEWQSTCCITSASLTVSDREIYQSKVQIGLGSYSCNFTLKFPSVAQICCMKNILPILKTKNLQCPVWFAQTALLKKYFLTFWLNFMGQAP